MKHGDIVEIGPHRILCGDCQDTGLIAGMFGNTRAATCIFSPPYLSRRDYGGPACKSSANIFSRAFANVPSTTDIQVFSVVGNLHVKGEQYPYWEEWLKEAQRAGWKRFAMYVWDKQHGYPGRFGGRLAPCFDLIFHMNQNAREPTKFRTTINPGRTTKAKYSKGYTLKNTSGMTVSIAQTKIDDSVIRVNPSGKCIGIGHPAVYPWQLPYRLLLSYGAPGGVVYDPMLGSGSTIIAAHEAGLVGYGCEINPDYCDLAVARIRKHMEKKR